MARPLLGDFIAGVTDALGIKKCGNCERRRKKMNDWDRKHTGHCPDCEKHRSQR